jgi:isocitrate lyase
MEVVSGRFDGIIRPYSKEDVRKLQGSMPEMFEYKYSTLMANLLWEQLNNKNSFLRALGAVNGDQAVQMVKAGLKSIYVSGWQVAASNNAALEVYPDQSLYPVNSVPRLVESINNALHRADEIAYSETGTVNTSKFVPLIADAEAGFGGPLNCFELMKAMIKAGAAGVHFEDQLSSAKKCGHLGGKVLIPGSQFVQSLVAARLAADVMNVPTLIIARTDANSANLLTSSIDEADQDYIKLEVTEDGFKVRRTSDGFFEISGGINMAINRGLQYAPYADVLWCETSKPDLKEAKQFADAIHSKFPGKLLAYNCSPSFNWSKHMSKEEAGSFQHKLSDMGYKFQFVTLAGYHSMNHAMFDLALAYNSFGMEAYSELQNKEFKDAEVGYTTAKHQRDAGVGYFDLVSTTVGSSLSAMEDSTEKKQF